MNPGDAKTRRRGFGAGKKTVFQQLNAEGRYSLYCVQRFVFGVSNKISKRAKCFERFLAGVL